MGALPARKTLASSRPPTAAEINYNFLALWNLLTGNVDAVNAPSLLSKVTGGDIQAAIRVINNGIVIGSALSPAGVAGKMLIDHPSALIELSSQDTNTQIGILLSRIAGMTNWGLVYDTTTEILSLTPAGIGPTFSLNAPVVHVGTGQVKRTETHYIGAIAEGADATRIIRIPNDAKRTGGEFKIRLIVNPDAADAIRDSHYHFNYRKTGDAYATGWAVPFTQFNAAANFLHVSDWMLLAGAPAAGDQFILLTIHNGPGGAVVNFTDATVELQYKIDREGYTTDAI
jgi:hypothetical protein